MHSFRDALGVSTIPVIARDRALLCCTEITRCFGVLPMPQEPESLRYVQLEQIRVYQRKADAQSKGGKRAAKLEPQERETLRAWNRWRQERSRVQYENASRLRGAFWALTTLRAVIANSYEEGGPDVECVQAERRLDAFVRENWTVPSGVRAEELQRAQIPAEVWQTWARDGEMPATECKRVGRDRRLCEPACTCSLPMRTAIAEMHALLLARELTLDAAEQQSLQEAAP